MSEYQIKVTRCSLGWLAVLNLLEKPTVVDAQGLWDLQMELLDPPSYWRPTRDGAIAAAKRKKRRWERRDAREATAEVVL